MNKSTLKAEFINAKIKDAKYIGVSIKTEGSSQPEIIINPRENFDAKFDYYSDCSKGQKGHPHRGSRTRKPIRGH